MSCPTEALFCSGSPEPLLLPKFSQALAVESSATATAYGESFSGLSAAACSTKFAQNGGIADLRHDPGFRYGLSRLFVSASDGSWAKLDWVAASRPACANHAGHYFSL